MLRWTVIFFALAIVAAIFGFGGVAAAFAEFGQILFFLFIAIAVISFIAGLFRR